MKTIYARDLDRFVGKEITFQGWVHSVRSLGKLCFVVLRDKTGTVQATFKQGVFEGDIKEVENVPNESVIEVCGTVQPKPKGGYEILAKNYKVISKSDPIPIEIWNPDVKTKLSNRIKYRFLDLRKPEVYSIFSVRQKVFNAFREILNEKNFVEMHTPKIVSIGAESGSEVFEVSYFGKTAYLSQSPQLYKQMLMASGVDRYYEIATYWRAEKSHTKRHITEFWMLDVEIAWIKDHYELVDFVKDLLTQVIDKTCKTCKEEFEVLQVEPEIPKRIPTITLDEAKNILKREFNKELPQNEDLDTEGERLLGTYFLDEYNEPIVIVLHYPWEKRPFYHMRLEEEPAYTKSFDVIYKGIEIATGSQREHRYDILVKQAREKGINPERLKYYLEAFKYGIPPHGGFGLGLDRFVKQLLNLEDIRECVLWPRDPEHILP